jgi:hypothetical protein
VRRRVLSRHGKRKYSDRLATATLTSLIILFEDCAVATNIAQAIRRSSGGLAIRQLSRGNGVYLADAEGLAREAMTMCKLRNKRSLRLHVAQDLLDLYPPLRDLLSSQEEKLQITGQ